MIPTPTIFTNESVPEQVADTQHDLEAEPTGNDSHELVVAGALRNCEVSPDTASFMQSDLAEFGSNIGTEDYIEDWCSGYRNFLSDDNRESVNETRNTKDLFARITGAIANVRRRSQLGNTSNPKSTLLSSHNLRRRVAPMHHALRGRDPLEVKRLAELGSDINIKISRTRPLQYATMRDDIDMVRMLISLGADVNGLDDFKLSPLVAAIRHDNFRIARLLVELGANTNASSTKSGPTPIVTAIHHGNLEMVKLLVDLGADIHTPFCYGWTPLTHAISSGAVEVVRLMVDLGVDVNLVVCGMTPLSLALRLSRRECEESERGRRYKDIVAILHAALGGRQAIDTLRVLLEQAHSGSYTMLNDQTQDSRQKSG